PQEFKERISDYVMLLESSKKATRWFSEREDLQRRITESLADLADVLPPETYPTLATLWLNDNIEAAQAILEDVRPELANPFGARLLLDRFGEAFHKNEAASLATDVRVEGRDYCRRFFTEHDEVLHLERFKADWG